VSAPAEGGEACRYADLGRSAADYAVSRLTGTWFLIAHTTRFAGISFEEAVTSVQVDRQAVNFTLSYFDR